MENSFGHALFERIISIENLFLAWKEFRQGKRNKLDVQQFEYRLENNLFDLHALLKGGRWEAQPYRAFFVRDPKLRLIHKASVRDRVVYQAFFRKLYPVFDPTFIYDSYSCRERKGTHAGSERLVQFVRKVSQNYSRPCYVLKCDIRKYFDSVSHDVLIDLVSRSAVDQQVRDFLERIIRGFENSPGKGIPLGNVTSQLFANIYLNPFDHFVKREIRARHYIRYCDDFVVVSTDVRFLQSLIPQMADFLHQNLRLELHPEKVSIRKVSHGIDFLGYVVLPHHKVMRTKTRRRLSKKIEIAKRRGDEQYRDALIQSAQGLASHARSYGLFG